MKYRRQNLDTGKTRVTIPRHAQIRLRTDRKHHRQRTLPTIWETAGSQLLHDSVYHVMYILPLLFASPSFLLSLFPSWRACFQRLPLTHFAHSSSLRGHHWLSSNNRPHPSLQNKTFVKKCVASHYITRKRNTVNKIEVLGTWLRVDWKLLPTFRRSLMPASSGSTRTKYTRRVESLSTALWDLEITQAWEGWENRKRCALFNDAVNF